MLSSLLLFFTLATAGQVTGPASAPPQSLTQSLTQSLPQSLPTDDQATHALALKIYNQMRTGKVDEALLSSQMNQALTPQLLSEKKPLFDQLGDPTSLLLQTTDKVGGGTRYTYLATFATAQLHVQLFLDAQGRVGGYMLTP